MRVVWITHNYPRAPGDISGAFLHPLAVALRARDVDVRVVAPADMGRGGRETLDGVPVHRVRYDRADREVLAYRGTMADALRSPRGLLTLLRLRNALRRGALLDLDGRSDAVVHAHWWVPGGLAAPSRVPLVVTSHGTDVRMLGRVPFAARLARRVYRRARVVTTVSRALAEEVTRQTAVPIADDAIQPMPVAALPRPVTDRRGGLVVIGRLDRQKRVDLAVDVVARLRATGMRITLTIVGDGAERAALERRASASGAGDVTTFVGAIPPERVPDVLAHATAALMPAVAEGFGLVAAEALMQGVPVIACRDGGGIVDVLAQGGGVVAAPDVERLAAAVRVVVGGDAAYVEARRAGEYWREHLSPEFVAERCVAWYQRAAHD